MWSGLNSRAGKATGAWGARWQRVEILHGFCLVLWMVFMNQLHSDCVKESVPFHSPGYPQPPAMEEES